MGRGSLRAMLLAVVVAARLVLAAASFGAAPPPPPPASWGPAARAPAEVEGQQECEHAAMRVEALQTGSALAGGAPSPAAEEASEEGIAAEEASEEGIQGNPYVPGPNIYLASIVDAKNYRGYCLDIAGSPPHPQCGSLQAHSCKEEGEDTQFMYVSERQEVRSLNFNSACSPLYSGTKNGRTWLADTNNTDRGCVTVSGGYRAGSTFALAKCERTVLQKIRYTRSRQLRVGAGSLCLVMGMNLTDEYEDFLIRSLELQPCDTWPAELSTWESILLDHRRMDVTKLDP